MEAFRECWKRQGNDQRTNTKDAWWRLFPNNIQFPFLRSQNCIKLGPWSSATGHLTKSITTIFEATVPLWRTKCTKSPTQTSPNQNIVINAPFELLFETSIWSSNFKPGFDLETVDLEAFDLEAPDLETVGLEAFGLEAFDIFYS